VPTDWNQDQDVGLTYKGYFAIFDGATAYKYMELIEALVTTAADSEKYYDVEGGKRKKSLGDSSNFEIRVKKSADLVAAGTPPYSGSDLKTISNFQEDIMNNRIIPTATFEGVQETEAASNKWMVANFTAFVENIEDTRNPSTGVPEVVISGEIKTWNSNRRLTNEP
jgi:hypothetical protein